MVTIYSRENHVPAKLFCARIVRKQRLAYAEMVDMRVNLY